MGVKVVRSYRTKMQLNPLKKGFLRYVCVCPFCFKEVQPPKEKPVWYYNKCDCGAIHRREYAVKWNL